jgi:sugar fermentation stimulation protein A
MMRVIHEYPELYGGILIRRYKRFLVDIRLDTGDLITAFTPNSGTMKTCSEPGSPVMLSYHPGTDRKTEFTLEMVRSGNTWVGVNTFLANDLGARIVDLGITGQSALTGFTVSRKEVIVEDSRFDLLAKDSLRDCFIEVKNVTYREGDTALFPDAVTGRGKKHLEALIRLVNRGKLACNLYVVQRSDCAGFSPAGEIDPDYAQAFSRAGKVGVLLISCLLHVNPQGISFVRPLPVKDVWR